MEFQQINYLNYNISNLAASFKDYATSSDQVLKALKDINLSLQILNNSFEKSQSFGWVQFLQIIASLAAAAAAYYSWKAVQQAEEISLKPIIALGERCFINDKFSVKVKNLSKEGDRWARNLEVSILNSNLKKIRKGYVGPGDETEFVFSDVKKEMWQGKTLVVSYLTVNNKKYESEYLLADDVSYKSSIHADATFVGVERVK